MQRLEDEEQDEDEEEEAEAEAAKEREQQQKEEPMGCNCNPVALNDKQYAYHNNQPQRSVQSQCEDADEEFEEQLEEEPSHLDIQFDLMHYKENVRYLRHTPSNSSLDLQQDREQEQRGFSFSLGSQFDGQYHNLIIRDQPPHDDYPIVKWDINGNSLEEEQDVEQPFDLRQHWANFDSRWRQLQALPSGKRLSSSNHSQRSSHHSSACTLETWIDDADEAQNLLQSSQKSKKKQQQQQQQVSSNYNNNNNNYNQCLKSF